MKQYKNRNEVEEKYKWDLTEYYKSDDEFFETYAKLNKELDILKEYVGCTTDTNKLYDYLQKEKPEIIQEALKEKHLGLIKKRKALTRILDRLRSIIRTFSWE